VVDDDPESRPRPQRLTFTLPAAASSSGNVRHSK